MYDTEDCQTKRMSWIPLQMTGGGGASAPELCIETSSSNWACEQFLLVIESNVLLEPRRPFIFPFLCFAANKQNYKLPTNRMPLRSRKVDRF